MKAIVCTERNLIEQTIDDIDDLRSHTIGGCCFIDAPKHPIWICEILIGGGKPNDFGSHWDYGARHFEHSAMGTGKGRDFYIGLSIICVETGQGPRLRRSFRL